MIKLHILYPGYCTEIFNYLKKIGFAKSSDKECCDECYLIGGHPFKEDQRIIADIGEGFKEYLVCCRHGKLWSEFIKDRENKSIGI